MMCTLICYGNQMFRVDFKHHTGYSIMVYGQTEVTRDLYEAREKSGGETVFKVEDVEIHDAKTNAPFVTYTKAGTSHRITCDFVAGCDGFHGISRKTIPQKIRKEYEKVYPFG